MKSLVDIVNRTPKPAPWSEGDNIPWNDPEFSALHADFLSRIGMTFSHGDYSAVETIPDKTDKGRLGVHFHEHRSDECNCVNIFT